MTIRRLLITITVAGLLATTATPASASGGPTGIRSVTAITKVYTFGQKVAAVALRYDDVVNPKTLDRGTFTVSDSIYNFRFDPLEDLPKRADRTVTRVYTNDEPALDPHGRSDRGRYVIVELDPSDPGGNTVIRSTCSGALCSERINPDLPTEVIQHENVYARSGRGKLLAAGGSTRHPLTTRPVNILADEFQYKRFEHPGMTVPYAFRLPEHYQPWHTYPLVVVLPGWGSGYDGQNEGVQVGVDVTAVAWAQPAWTGSREEVIILAPQTERIGTPAEVDALVALLNSFTGTYNVDRERIYASGFSWGTTLAYRTMAEHPGLFAAALINAGFTVSDDQAARIAATRTPVWITHGTGDPVLPVTNGRTSGQRLRDAYVAAGVDPAEVAGLVHYTEFPNEAYSQPDYHAVVGPTYETRPILHWLLGQ
ncbi:dienelactone hydrolase family protein [Nonomuraea sp. MTCD27]|uniref:dienelactone hydrolase family protein n=1 Tax=Nonomuraea sp. MTCD27 TaxID=1676747 RepID=UPI0035BF1B87